MGKYMRKAKITGEVVVMEVSQSTLGVRTRARTLALQRLQNTTATTTTSSSSYLELRSRRLEKTLIAEPKEACKQNPNHISKNGDEEESFEENVLEFEGDERNVRETTPSSLIRDSETLETPGSTTRRTSSTATTKKIQNTMRRNIPSAQEMEEFFASAEQQQQTIFMEKYNYDPISDTPIPGRYEWVRI